MKKLVVNEDMCFGCGFCIASNERFEMNEDGKSFVKDDSEIKDEELEELTEIAEGCPVEAIKIVEEN